MNKLTLTNQKFILALKLHSNEGSLLENSFKFNLIFALKSQKRTDLVYKALHNNPNTLDRQKPNKGNNSLAKPSLSPPLKITSISTSLFDFYQLTSVN